MKRKYIIKDWASNVLQYNGKFKSTSYGSMGVGVPMKFNSFDDAWDWIYTNIDDEEAYQDLIVEELTK